MLKKPSLKKTVVKTKVSTSPSTGQEPERGIRRTFKYKRRAPEQVSTRNSNVKDPWTLSEVEMYKIREGENRIRILPPTWENPVHHGHEIEIHYGIGDRRQYICPKAFNGSDCPVCQEAVAAYQENDSKYGQQCLATSSWLIWVLDRLDTKNPEKPKLWKCTRGTDEELMILAKDRDTGGFIEIDHPDQGYDVCFDGVKKTAPINGQKINFMEVKGLQILLNKPNAVPDSVLKYISENPIPEMLVLYDYQHILEVFNGGNKHEASTEDIPSSDGQEKEDYTFDEITKMRLGELEDICLGPCSLDEERVREMTKEQLIEAVCDYYGVEVKAAPKKKLDFKAKLVALRKK